MIKDQLFSWENVKLRKQEFQERIIIFSDYLQRADYDKNVSFNVFPMRWKQGWKIYVPRKIKEKFDTRFHAKVYAGNELEFLELLCQLSPPDLLKPVFSFSPQSLHNFACSYIWVQSRPTPYHDRKISMRKRRRILKSNCLFWCM